MDISFIQIWRVETNQLCEIPWDEHGIFVNGSCYIVLNRIQRKSKSLYILYYWLVSIVFCRSLFIYCRFSFGHCLFCPPSIYVFWFTFWYFQALLDILGTQNCSWITGWFIEFFWESHGYYLISKWCLRPSNIFCRTISMHMTNSVSRIIKNIYKKHKFQNYDAIFFTTTLLI